MAFASDQKQANHPHRQDDHSSLLHSPASCAMTLPFKLLAMGAIALMTLLTTTVVAQTWTTYDGKVSLARPDFGRFQSAELAAGLSVAWISRDETITLGLTEMPAEPGIEIDPASVAAGAAEMVSGKVLSSDVDDKAKHFTQTVAVMGTVDGKETHIVQKLIHVDNVVYKAMVIGRGKDPRPDPDVQTFLASMKVSLQKPEPTTPDPTSPAEPQPELDSAKPTKSKSVAVSDIPAIEESTATTPDKSGHDETESPPQPLRISEAAPPSPDLQLQNEDVTKWVEIGVAALSIIVLIMAFRQIRR